MLQFHTTSLTLVPPLELMTHGLLLLFQQTANDSDDATLLLPTPTGSTTFQVGRIQIDTNDLDSTLSASAAQ